MHPKWRVDWLIFDQLDGMMEWLTGFWSTRLSDGLTVWFLISKIEWVDWQVFDQTEWMMGWLTSFWSTRLTDGLTDRFLSNRLNDRMTGFWSTRLSDGLTDRFLLCLAASVESGRFSLAMSWGLCWATGATHPSETGTLQFLVSAAQLPFLLMNKTAVVLGGSMKLVCTSECPL